MMSVKQGGIKYHFLSLWYDSTWDWTQVSRAIGEHSNRLTSCIWSIDETLNGIATSVQIELLSDDGVLHILKIWETWASTSDVF